MKRAVKEFKLKQITFGTQVNQLHSRRSVLMFNGCNFLILCRSYEEVGWDAKLPRRLKAPETTLEKTADPVSERPSSRRYSSRPELWQVRHGGQTVTNAAQAGARLFSSPAVSSLRFTLIPTTD